MLTHNEEAKDDFAVQELLKLHNLYSIFLSIIVLGNKIWIQCYEPESRKITFNGTHQTPIERGLRQHPRQRKGMTPLCFEVMVRNYAQW